MYFDGIYHIQKVAAFMIGKSATEIFPALLTASTGTFSIDDFDRALEIDANHPKAFHLMAN